MKIGFNLPNIGAAASPQAIIRVAKRAEELGYDSLWAIERLLWPIKPQTPYPGTPEGSPLPEFYKIAAFDPLHTLTFAAANTSRIALGTSIINIAYHNPITLARELTTIDVLSGGRLKAGFGHSWSKDEVDATSGVWKQRGARADEFLQLLKAIWTMNPIEFNGKFFHLPKSFINPKPIQKPHPPIYLAAYGPGPMNRIAKFADGWNPAGIPIDGMVQMMGHIRDLAKKVGRNPTELKLVVRANLNVTSQPLEEKRRIFTGSEDEIRSDVQATKKIADEIIFDPTLDTAGTSAEGFLKRMEQAKNWVT